LPIWTAERSRSAICFHSEFCEQPDDHDRVQDEILADELRERNAREDAQEAARLKREREALDRLLGWKKSASAMRKPVKRNWITASAN
jgi:hypothetical protein